jgi:hypothetical protein
LIGLIGGGGARGEVPGTVIGPETGAGFISRLSFGVCLAIGMGPAAVSSFPPRTCLKTGRAICYCVHAYQPEISKVHTVRCFRQLAKPPVLTGCTLARPAATVRFTPGASGCAWKNRNPLSKCVVERRLSLRESSAAPPLLWLDERSAIFRGVCAGRGQCRAHATFAERKATLMPRERLRCVRQLAEPPVPASCTLAASAPPGGLPPQRAGARGKIEIC